MVDCSPMSTDSHSDDDGCYELIDSKIEQVEKKAVEEQTNLTTGRKEEASTVSREAYQQLETDSREWTGFAIEAFYYLSNSNILLATLIILFPNYKGWFVFLLFLINVPVSSYSTAIKYHKTIWNWIVAIDNWYYGKMPNPTPVGPLRTYWLRKQDGGGVQFFKNEEEAMNHKDEAITEVGYLWLNGTSVYEVSEGVDDLRRGDRIVSLSGLEAKGMSGAVLSDLFARVETGATMTVRYDHDHLAMLEKKGDSKNFILRIIDGIIVSIIIIISLLVVYGIYRFFS